MLCAGASVVAGFFISGLINACVANNIAVIAPTHATISKNCCILNTDNAKNNGAMRATKNTPAFTIVAAWMSAETEVGPVMASNNHSFNGN
jgi:hypothetical protein